MVALYDTFCLGCFHPGQTTMADNVTVLILLVAGQHSFSGDVKNRGSRVLELLNDPSTGFQQLSHVTVQRGFFAGSATQLDEATIPKAAIDLLLLEPNKHEAPLRRRPANVEQRFHSVFVLVSDHDIRGTLMLTGTSDFIGAFAGELTAFFPWIKVRISTAAGEIKPASTGVAIVNQSKVLCSCKSNSK
jgi:hypothetical protein